MKKLIFLVFALFSVSAIMAQAHFGIHGAISLNAIKTSEKPGGIGNTIYADPLFGAFVEMQAGKHFAIQPELNFTGYRAASSTGQAKFCFQYVQVPVLLKFMTSTGVNFIAGPQLGFLTKAQSESNLGVNTDIKDQLNGTDFSGVFGLEYIFENGINMGMRYQTGFSNLYRVEASDSYESKTRSLQFCVGYIFGHKRKNAY